MAKEGVSLHHCASTLTTHSKLPTVVPRILSTTMASFMSYFTGRRDTKQSARDAIVGLRQQLQLIEKKEEHLQKKVEQELKVAKANAVSNKPLATAALKRKRAHETQLEQLRGQQMQLEMQVNTLESANLNAETMAAMKKASEVLQQIHGNMSVTKVDETMAAINEQREVANEITELISNPLGTDPLADDELAKELAELEDEALTDRLMGADHVPVHVPPGASRSSPALASTMALTDLVGQPAAAVEDDEEAMLRQLQAEMAM
ncbi:Vacuolar sorting protein [Mycena kentingensis (nom. inval.)]|nr:Vacuolar sorting protein [Mycena kentingensis (nom. inval.)]